jgi:hypothetical protein
MLLRWERVRADAFLYDDGRDIEEPTELTLRWDADLTGGVIAGEASEYRPNEQRAAVIRALEEAGGPMRPREVANAVGKHRPPRRPVLRKGPYSKKVCEKHDPALAI